ncbi:Fic family protein [Nocardia sp. NPDC050710]|uniref:Fic/DOC family protein n=1 Tax=Nocardia sp. NPDC050710 TaxID=3157220 RepID=UPI0033D858A6
MSQDANWDSYLWPSDAGAGKMMLRNLYGVHNVEELLRREYAETTDRAWEIESGEVKIPSTGDLTEWQALHGHLLGGVYSWAGELRTVRFTQGDGHYFLNPDHFEECIPLVFDSVRDLDWASLTRFQFIDHAARFHMLLNWVHPFREGNGRATRLFLDRQIASAPYALDYSRVDADRWNAAAMASRPTTYVWPSNHMPLVSVFNEITIRADAPAGSLDPLNPLDLQQIIDNARHPGTSGQDIAATIGAAIPGQEQIIGSTLSTDRSDADERDSPLTAPDLDSGL